jgi:hypothetical protein
MGRLIHDVAVPQRREYAADSRLADFAAEGALVIAHLSHDIRQSLEPLDHDDIVQVGPRVVEVGTEIIADLVAHVGHGLVEYACD